MAWEVAVQEEAHHTIAAKPLLGIKMEAMVTVVALEAAVEVVVAAEEATVVAEEAEVIMTLHLSANHKNSLDYGGMPFG